MFLRRFKHVLMDAAAGADGGHSSGGAGTPPDDRTGNAGAPAPAAAAPGAAPASALAAATQPGPHDHIPEKHRVLGADGSLDVEATLRKNAEAYSALEKRLGQGGDAPPAAATDYKIEPPETLKDAFSPEDESFKAFLGKAHAAKLTQAQLDVVMGAFFETAPKLVGGAVELDADACIAELGRDWKTPDALHSNFVAADRAIQQLAGGAADALRAKYGNDPDFLRFAATVGAQLKEDRAPGGANVTSAEDIASLERSEAYSNPKHPDHEKVSRQVREHYQRVAEANPGMIV